MIVQQLLSSSNYELANFTVVLQNISNGDTALNITVEVFQDLLQVPVYLSFSVPASKNDKNYEKTILKATINVCRILDGVAGNFVAKMLVAELTRASNIPLQCPFPKGSYKFINFVLNDKYLPSYLFVSDLKYLINVKVMAKLANQKNLVLLFNAKSYGCIGRN